MRRQRDKERKEANFGSQTRNTQPVKLSGVGNSKDIQQMKTPVERFC